LLHGSVPWITLLDSSGQLNKWLYESDEEKIDQTVWLLNSVQKNYSEQIVALVEPFVNVSERWNSRLNMMMAWGGLFASRSFFDLFLRLIDEGLLDNLRGPIAVNSDFWSLLYSLPEKNAEWCCEMISHYFNRRLSISLVAGGANPFSEAIPDSQLDSSILLDSAQRAPHEFVSGILPFMLAVIESNIVRENGMPLIDKVWSYRSIGESYSVSGNLFDAMEAALSSLAEKDVPAFTIIIEQLEPLEFEAIQFLLIRAFSANGKEFADRAADYLCEKPYRLQTGYSSNSHWATRQLLEAITPFCSKENLEKLESLILDYYSEWEKDAKGLYSRGNAQFTLLEGFALDRRSVRLTKRLEEWRRKFQKAKPAEPRPSKVFTVASPIPETALDKMTDEQWLRAIAKYDHEEMRTRSLDRVTGGSFQLSQVLENVAKKEARRFVGLALKFPDTAHPDYFNAILRGIMGADLDIEKVLPVCIKCHNLPGKPCGRWVHRPIAALAEKALPQEALEMVSWYATEDPDPEKEMWRTEASSGSFYYGGKILDAAINSVRGSACESMAKLIFANSNYISFFLPSIKKMVNDPSIAVRSCVAEVLTAILSHDRELAVSLFAELCQTEDVLLGTPYVERFLYYAVSTHFAFLKPVLELMIASETPKVQKVGARQLCLASLDMEEATPFAMKCLEGTENHRIGAAQIFSANLQNAHFRIFCEESLLKLLNDESEKVQSAATRCFDSFEGEQLIGYVGFLDKYLQSSSFKKGYNRLFLALEKTTADISEITCRACERFVDTFGTDASDIRTGVAADAMKVSTLIVRVYSQATDKLLQKRCLDVIDKMMLVGMYGLDEAISTFDR
jgi:HEAT repeat